MADTVICKPKLTNCVCDAGYKMIQDECEKKVCGEYAAGENWSETIIRGTKWKYCGSDGKISCEIDCGPVLISDNAVAPCLAKGCYPFVP